MFPKDSRESKTNCFPRDLTLCLVIFLDFHFNSDRRITRANQNSQLGYLAYNCYKNTTLCLMNE